MSTTLEIINAGSSEVNGVYAYAKTTRGMPEYWNIKQVKKNKKVLDMIYKIRGGANFSSYLGENYKQCWLLFCMNEQLLPIHYYAAPMKSLNDVRPPTQGWTLLGGIEPLPKLIDVNIDDIKQSYQNNIEQIKKLKNEIGSLKDNIPKDKQKEDKTLNNVISNLNKLQEKNDDLESKIKCNNTISEKVEAKTRSILDDVAKSNFLYSITADIYGGCSGLYDYGPTGAAIKQNMIQEWRNWFIIEDDMLEVESTMLTPEIVLKTSGHVDLFSDLMLQDEKNGQCYRADKYLQQYFQKLKNDNIINNNDEKKNIEEEYDHIINTVDTMKTEQIEEVIKKHKIKSPDDNNLIGPYPFNLMFSTPIGPTGKIKGYLRPETAQGIFVNFDKLLKYNNGNMPFAAAQIGHSFRNEIAPRGGLLRVREFQMAEIEHFCNDDVNDVEHPKFQNIKNTLMKFLPKKSQEDESNTIIECTMNDAVYKYKLITNTTLGYYLARTFLYFKKIGLDLNRIRFRQHKSNEMAHYARDCWDAEILSTYGWIECVGHADRACFDLNNHANQSGTSLKATRVLKEPRQVTKINRIIDRKKIGGIFKKDSKIIIDYLEKLNEEKANELHNNLQKNKEIEIEIEIKTDDNNNNNNNKNKYKINNELFLIKEEQVIEQAYHFTPSVVEPSFGIGRILYSLLEHCLWNRVEDENRVVLSLPPKIAPIKVMVMPLSNKESLLKLASQLHGNLKKYNIASKIDESTANVGKKYSRADEIGIPFVVVIDFQTLNEINNNKDPTVTIRERDSTIPQIRVKIDEASQLLHQLSNEFILWDDVLKKYPHHEGQELEK